MSIKKTAPQPTPQTGTNEPETVVELRPAKGARKGFFQKNSVRMSEAMAKKQQTVSEAKQRLAEAKEYWDEGDSKVKEAEECASKGAILLYRAVVDKAVQPNEVSPILGDLYGYKQKGKDAGKLPPVTAADKNASKTPYGPGEVIRKRLKRMIDAHETVNGGNGGKFFEGLPVDKLKDVLNGIEKGQIGFWAGYTRFADIAKEAREAPVALAFNPSRIAGITESLHAKGASEMILQSKPLRDAYLELWGVLEILSQELEAMVEGTGTNG